MTVGCVILTVPRRKRVSQAVTDETARASTEMVREAGSAIRHNLLEQFNYTLLCGIDELI
jgi:hypothetical protein